ncbi:flagellar biogenesis protein FliO [Hydrogenoanaerobacterium saccharovorans]|uniref:Flagellar biogenesis protein FliO n=1 Tax=Hydrogenoanaerobacterium saccharovorans TaxID=474960 RepID=A0A1H7ZVJ9_9FIRM|nr:flagellar biosynthetic protein FliO [Hydrogenoanaerobacterium saccharovorans]RPF48401.1 flagellar biogenesis protein FliO [Hydrogenoanaerobacterium saccharovorans]SEM61529.1 Flagellar biogenesis protein FliO [Hydrogenoanaerobacterium saccharovorans]
MPQVLFSLVMLILILTLAYYTTKWIGKRCSIQNGSKIIQVLDKVVVGQDKMLMIIRVQNQTMLVGMTSHSVQKLCDIENIDELLIQSKASETDFSSILSTALRDGLGAKLMRKKKKEDDAQ